MKKAGTGLVILIILAIILIVFVFLFRGLILYLLFGKVTMNLCTSSLTKGFIPIATGSRLNNVDDCIYAIAFSNNKPNLCEQVSNKDFRDQCMMGISLAYNESEVCKTVTTEQWASQCRQRFG